jgi:hypothetical protein
VAGSVGLATGQFTMDIGARLMDEKQELIEFAKEGLAMLKEMEENEQTQTQTPSS